MSIAPDVRELPAVAELLRATPLKPGTPLIHADYERLRDELLQACRRAGFFKPRFRRAELRVDVARREAQAVLDLDAGRRKRFGEIVLSGSQLDTALLARLAPFRKGDWFDAVQMARFEQRLRDTGYFSELVVRVRRSDAEMADIEVLAADVTESRYDVGAGFSTDSDLRLRFSRNSPLLNSRGDSLSTDAELSATRQSLESTWRIPHSDPLDDVFELSTGVQGKSLEDTESITMTSGIAHAMKVFGDWSYRYGISAELERYTVGSETQKDVAYLLPATSISRTSLAPGLDPPRGYSLWTSVDFSDSSVGSPADFVRWRGGLGLLRSLHDDKTRVLARVELGAIWTDSFNEIPASLRFYAGGDRSIRGYDYETLAPRDVNGKLLGGRYLAVGSVEVSRRVRPNWRVAAFVDGGGAFTERNDDLYQSAGIGLRWLSPIGQIRFDLAAPVHDRENTGIKLHVSMGPPL
jgi:translocation and assembly module TamA